MDDRMELNNECYLLMEKKYHKLNSDNKLKNYFD